ncbi:MAG: phosphopantetheine--protein transferase domain protein [Verrucomicrobia bacterium]|jgi:holo-[acyl-carrier protein] synthase|nr:phosphopantetheine--protein transferase domain protein [Verrucomicrobiota bacterium]
MILGLGIDLVETARIQASMDRFGDTFLERFLLPREIEFCKSHRFPLTHVAARFAAKEAVAKAFGTGLGEALGWHDIEIGRKPTGEPFLVLHEKAIKLFQSRGGKGTHLSLTHTESYAAAVVVIEG